MSLLFLNDIAQRCFDLQRIRQSLQVLGHISGHSKRKWLIVNCCPTWIRTMNKGSKGFFAQG